MLKYLILLLTLGFVGFGTVGCEVDADDDGLEVEVGDD
jgi:hypothetical protein